MEQCPSMNALSLNSIEIDEDHCRVLGAYSRSGLKIELNRCKYFGRGYWTQPHSRPSLISGKSDNFVLADGLRGNSRLKSFAPRIWNRSDAYPELLAIARVLRENKSLVHLNPSVGLFVNDET
jgi:hypothetical protein